MEPRLRPSTLGGEDEELRSPRMPALRLHEPAAGREGAGALMQSPHSCKCGSATIRASLASCFFLVVD